MPKKILIVTDDSGESFEILYAQHRFREAGWQPVIAATQKKLLNGVLHDFCPGWNTYVEKPGYLIRSDIAFDRVRARDYEALLLIGGRAPEFLRYNKHLIRIVQQMHRDGKWLLSICHGVQVLVAAGVCDGINLTCYENVRLEVTQCGGKWSNKQSVVDADARIISAQTWESHADFYRDIFEQLGR